MKKILFSSVCALALCGTSVFAEGVQDSSSSAPTQTLAKPFSFDWATLSTGLDTDLGNAKTEYEKFVTTQMTQAVTTAKGNLDSAKEATATAKDNLDKKIAEIGKSTDKVDESGEGSLYAKLNKAGADLVGKASETAPSAVADAKNLTDLLAFYEKDAETNKTKITAVKNAIKDINAGKPVDLTTGDINTALTEATGITTDDGYKTAKGAIETAETALGKPTKGDTPASGLYDALEKAEKDETEKQATYDEAVKAVTDAENDPKNQKATALYKELQAKKDLFDKAATAQKTINDGTTAKETALASAKETLTTKQEGVATAKDSISKAQKALGSASDKASDAKDATLYAKLNKEGSILLGDKNSVAPESVDKAKNLYELAAWYKSQGDSAKSKLEEVNALISKIEKGEVIGNKSTELSTTNSEATGLVYDETNYKAAQTAVSEAINKLGTDKADGKGTTLFDALVKAQEELKTAQEGVTTAEKDLKDAQKAVADAKATLEKAVLYTDDGIKAVASVKASLGEYASIAGGKANVLAAKFALVGSDISKADKEQQKEIQTVANEIAKTIVDNKKEEISSNALTSLAIQLNNMNKRLGEVRGMGGDTGVWTRVYGGKYSTDYDKFNYYSAQIGADKKSALKDGDLILGILAGYDKVNADIKTDAYSFGIYGSYIHNSGFFADSVMKFVSTSHDKSGWDIANQKSFLASLEGGYRFDASESFYVEPSLEFITGHVSEYSAKQAKTTTTVESFSPVIFKPQTFIGVNLDDLAFRFGGGYVLNAKKQEANIMIEDIVAGVNASASTKLEKNNHSFVSLGTSYKIGDNLRLNLSAERTFGGELQKDYEINTTIRYSF